MFPTLRRVFVPWYYHHCFTKHTAASRARVIQGSFLLIQISHSIPAFELHLLPIRFICRLLPKIQLHTRVYSNTGTNDSKA
jgi:hypothetical protein